MGPLTCEGHIWREVLQTLSTISNSKGHQCEQALVHIVHIDGLMTIMRSLVQNTTNETKRDKIVHMR